MLQRVIQSTLHECLAGAIEVVAVHSRPNVETIQFKLLLAPIQPDINCIKVIHGMHE